MTPTEITNWMAAKMAKLSKEHGLKFQALTATIYADTDREMYARWFLHHDDRTHMAASPEEATQIIIAKIGNHRSQAAAKREEAAKLIKQADELEGKV